MSTMENKAPPCFFGDKKEESGLRPADQGFGNRFGSYERYSGTDGGQAAKDVYKEDITRIVESVQGTVNGRPNCEFKSLAKHLLNQTLALALAWSMFNVEWT